MEITVVKDGAITDITMLQEGDGDGHSRQINNYAVPTADQRGAEGAVGEGVGDLRAPATRPQGVLKSVSSAIQQAGL